MSLFDLSHEEDKSMVTSGVEGDYEEPEEVHPEAAGAEGEQIEHLSRVLNTIDSLESARVTYMDMKRNEMEYSAESMRTINQVLSERISMAYQMNGLKEEFPVHISTESFSTLHGSRNAITLALEELDSRIAVLSTEANGFFERFNRNVKEVFGAEFNTIERIKENIVKLINDIENSENFMVSGNLTVKNAYALTIGNRLNLDKVIDNISEGVKNHFGNGEFIENYFRDLEVASKIFDNLNWGRGDEVINTMERKNIFKLTAPFKELPDDKTKFNKFEWKVSDLNSMVVPMPKGSTALIPSSPYSNGKVEVGLFSRAKPKSSDELDLPSVGKQQLLKNLRNFLDCLENLPDVNQFNRITNNMKKRIKKLADESLTLSKHQKDSTEWNSDDWKALGTSLVLPSVIFYLFGPAGFLTYNKIKPWVALFDLLANISRNDAMSNVKSNSMQEINPYLRGGAAGTIHTLFTGLVLKKYINSFENKTTLFFIGTYRELYTIIRSTANALLSYGYASIGESNKY